MTIFQKPVYYPEVSEYTILETFNEKLEDVVDLKVTLNTVLTYLQKLTKCNAAAIRLKNFRQDFPYYVWLGFENSFIRHENSLLCHNTNGHVVYHKNTNQPILECMCGNIIKEHIDPSQNFFTTGGSFWTNSTSEFLISVTKNIPHIKTCNYCNSCGYESVALIPIKCKTEVIGMIQLNDKQKNRFSNSLITLLETMGKRLGRSINKSYLYDRTIQLEKAFQKTFFSCPCPLILIAENTLEIIDINQSFLRLLERKRDELVEQSATNFSSIIFPDDYQTLLDLIIKKRVFSNLKCRFKSSSNQLGTVYISSNYITIDNQAAILLSVVDVTELSLYKEHMDRVSCLNLVGEMAASIGHEIRNPMTTVRGYLQLLQKNKEFQPYDEQFAIMIEELDRANSIITEFLALAKNKANHFTQQNLNQIIRKAMPLLLAIAYETGHNIEFNLQQIPNLLLDKNDIHKMLLNLAKNGFEAMNKRGTLTISTYQAQQTVILEIKDEGSGIPLEALNSLGKPFFTTKESGTGLGLAVCYQVAERHHAQIQIKTTDTGSTFTVIFNCDDSYC